MNAFLMQIFLVLNIYTRNPKTRAFKWICVLLNLHFQTACRLWTRTRHFGNFWDWNRFISAFCFFVCSQSDVSHQTAALNFTNFQGFKCLKNQPKVHQLASNRLKPAPYETQGCDWLGWLQSCKPHCRMDLTPMWSKYIHKKNYGRGCARLHPADIQPHGKTCATGCDKKYKYIIYYIL